MSQIIEELINEVGLVRFSILSEDKIQLDYRVPIMCNGSEVKTIRIKSRYKKNNNHWLYIRPKERFLNKLSVSNSIKKRNILFKEAGTSIIKVDSVEYRLDRLLNNIIFDDLVWYRDKVLKAILN